MAGRREALIGRTYAGLEGRVTVTGVTGWSREYVGVELADGTESVRLAEHVWNAYRRKSA